MLSDHPDVKHSGLENNQQLDGVMKQSYCYHSVVVDVSWIVLSLLYQGNLPAITFLSIYNTFNVVELLKRSLYRQYRDCLINNNKRFYIMRVNELLFLGGQRMKQDLEKWILEFCSYWLLEGEESKKKERKRTKKEKLIRFGSLSHVVGLLVIWDGDNRSRLGVQGVNGVLVISDVCLCMNLTLWLINTPETFPECTKLTLILTWANALLLPSRTFWKPGLLCYWH